jgi:hypothetical protein
MTQLYSTDDSEMYTQRVKMWMNTSDEIQRMMDTQYHRTLKRCASESDLEACRVSNEWNQCLRERFSNFAREFGKSEGFSLREQAHSPRTCSDKRKNESNIDLKQTDGHMNGGDGQNAWKQIRQMTDVYQKQIQQVEHERDTIQNQYEQALEESKKREQHAQHQARKHHNEMIRYKELYESSLQQHDTLHRGMQEMKIQLQIAQNRADRKRRDDAAQPADELSSQTKLHNDHIIREQAVPGDRDQATVLNPLDHPNNPFLDQKYDTSQSIAQQMTIAERMHVDPALGRQKQEIIDQIKSEGWKSFGIANIRLQIQWKAERINKLDNKRNKNVATTLCERWITEHVESFIRELFQQLV